VAFYSLPKVALAPMFILWFGVGLQMRILFTAVIVLFLVFLNTYTGVRNVSRELITVFPSDGRQRTPDDAHGDPAVGVLVDLRRPAAFRCRTR
jgi:ABC-type nitrate/sulfonate/bicarbonate transport system permease component